MTTKRKLAAGSVDETPNYRTRERRRSILQAHLPKLGLLWGTEGSVDSLLDRASDVSDMYLALEHHGASKDEAEMWTEERLEGALTEVLDSCHAQLAYIALETASVEGFFTRVRDNVAWTRGLSINIVMETCLKLLAARRAHRNSGRKFHRIHHSPSRSLVGAIDRFDAALDPGVAAAWLETFIVPVEGEQADDEMDHEPCQMRTAEERRCQKRRMTIDRQHAPHTPPRLLRVETGSGLRRVLQGVKAGSAPIRVTRRTAARHGRQDLVSPSKAPSRDNSSDADAEILVGDLASMALDDHEIPRRSSPRRHRRSQQQRR